MSGGKINKQKKRFNTQNYFFTPQLLVQNLFIFDESLSEF